MKEIQQNFDLNNQILIRKSFIDSNYGQKEIIYPKSPKQSPKKQKRKASQSPQGEIKNLKKQKIIEVVKA